MIIHVFCPENHPFDELLQQLLRQSFTATHSFHKSASAAAVIAAAVVVILHEEQNDENNKPEYGTGVAFAATVVSENVKHNKKPP